MHGLARCRFLKFCGDGTMKKKLKTKQAVDKQESNSSNRTTSAWTLTLPDCLERWKDGSIRVAGHRVMLYHIVDAIYEKSDLQELRNRFPTISKKQLRAIMEFCDEHTEAMQRLWEELRPEADLRRRSTDAEGPSRDELVKRRQQRLGQRRPD